MLKKILAVLAVVVAAFAGIVMTRPATFEIKRSLAMNAPPEIVQAQLTNFKAWDAWSPWDKLDPAMKKTFSGPFEGVGASYAWDSTNSDVGAGEMKITEVKDGERVGIDLHFMRPFEANNHLLFDLALTGNATTVTWSMSGKNDFMAKAAGLFMDMDKMVGADFEKGLASLKTASEAGAVVKKAYDAAPPPAEAAAPTDAGTP